MDKPASDTDGFGSAKHGLLVVDHGSKLATSNAQIVDMERRVRAIAPESAVVTSCHMEIASPGIEDGVRTLVDEVRKRAALSWHDTLVYVADDT